MADRLVFDLEPVLAFVQNHLPGFSRADGMRAIGLERRGALIAGVVFEGFNGKNMWIHVAAAQGGRWLTRTFLKACFTYAFEICRVDRLSGYVNASNQQARAFDEHLGFKEEARLEGAAPDGGDVIVYRMRRKECRYV